MASSFAFSSEPLDPAAQTRLVADPACGGFASFEGWVRDHNEGQRVLRLDYEAYVELAQREGNRICAEAERRFGVRQVRCVHRVGELALGDLAVWVGVAAPHRAEAFAACRYVIDEVKHRVPIWKKEYYVGGDSGWVNCERCAQAADDGHGHQHESGHDHDHGHADHDAAHAATVTPPASDYSRQRQLREVGAEGQLKLRRARVLVVGAGGLGVPVLSYLAGAGVGVLGIMDGDVLDASNLHRQTMYALTDVGRPKALLAAAHLRALNPEVDVRPFVALATGETLAPLAPDYDVIVDCSDNFAATYAIHDAARAAGRAAVFASVYQYEGQLQVVRACGAGSCLRCIWEAATPDGVVGNCAQAGVLGPVPGVLGSLQALETLKLILDLPGALHDELLLIDLLSLETRRVRAPRNPACAGGCVRLQAAAPGTPLELEFAALDDVAASGYLLVDIRESAERQQDPAPAHALHVPLASLLDDPLRIPAGKPVVLMCASGRRSSGATQALRARGLTQVWSLKGGIASYRPRVTVALAP